MRRTIPWIAILAAATIVASGCGENQGARAGAASPSAATGKDTATAIFAGGCFWCVESAFDDLPGVVEAISGYTGGKKANPSYDAVSAGGTGHYEAVQVRYDPAKIGYADLLEVFWRQIDPTDSGGQFADRGDQYRAAIFVQDPSQRRLAEASREALVQSGWFDEPIVTPILAAVAFYPAEAYHQDYHRNHSAQYKAYRWGSGRGPYLEKFWKDKPAAKPVSESPGQGDLRSRLTPLQYRVTQEQGTEPPFHNEYWDHHEPGIYVDVVTGEPLFSSLDKFDSGTGWPSFVRPLEPRNVVEKTDHSLGMARTEVRSRAGDSHLGHLFPDGPPPTGMRYCINSAALRFVPADELEAEGYGKFASAFKKAGKRASEGS